MECAYVVVALARPGTRNRRARGAFVAGGADTLAAAVKLGRCLWDTSGRQMVPLATLVMTRGAAVRLGYLGEGGNR